MPENLYSKITVDQVTEVYLNTEATAREAAAKLGISFRTFTRVLKNLGIKAKGRRADHIQLRDKSWLIDQYCNQLKSCKEIADEIGATRGAVYSSLLWAGVQLRDQSEGLAIRYPNGRYGPDASNWRGGRRQRHGYVQIYKPDHPYHSIEGYVMEHRLVMEAHLGRFLDPLEEVHHINEIKNDNRIENLQVLSHKEHRRLHVVKRLKAKREQLDQQIEKLDCDSN